MTELLYYLTKIKIPCLTINIIQIAITCRPLLRLKYLFSHLYFSGSADHIDKWQESLWQLIMALAFRKFFIIKTITKVMSWVANWRRVVVGGGKWWQMDVACSLELLIIGVVVKSIGGVACLPESTSNTSIFSLICVFRLFFRSTHPLRWPGGIPRGVGRGGGPGFAAIALRRFHTPVPYLAARLAPVAAVAALGQTPQQIRFGAERSRLPSQRIAAHITQAGQECRGPADSRPGRRCHRGGWRGQRGGRPAENARILQQPPTPVESGEEQRPLGPQVAQRFPRGKHRLCGGLQLGEQFRNPESTAPQHHHRWLTSGPWIPGHGQNGPGHPAVRGLHGGPDWRASGEWRRQPSAGTNHPTAIGGVAGGSCFRLLGFLGILFWKIASGCMYK